MKYRGVCLCVYLNVFESGFFSSSVLNSLCSYKVLCLPHLVYMVLGIKALPL